MDLTIIEDGDVLITYTLPDTQVVQVGGEGGGGVSSWNDLTDKPTTFPPSIHTHDDRYFTETEVTTALSGKSDTSHNHDDTYYTETEVNDLLDERAAAVHTHTTSQVVGLDTVLTGKADTTHTHAYGDITGEPTLPLSLNVKKTSSTAYTSTTLADDPDLQFALPVGDYDFELFVLYDGSVNNDMKLSLEFSGTATCALLAGSYASSTSTSFSSVTGLTTVTSGFNISTLFGFGGNMFAGANGVGVTLGFRIQGRVFVTSTGTIKARIAKNSPTDAAIDTNALPGSYMSAVEVISSP